MTPDADSRESSRTPSHPLAALLHLASRPFVRMTESRLNGQVGLVFDFAVAIALLGAGLGREQAPVTGVLVFLSGLALFTFVEYAVHRWLFHGAISAFEQGHTRHHEQPLGYDALPFFLPPLAMLLIVALLASALPTTDALLLAAALATGYAIYGVSHSAMHARRFRNAHARRWAAAHHVHHHHPRTNFGVTTPFWDNVFGTRYHQPRAGSAIR